MYTYWLEEHLETFVRPRLGHIPGFDPKSNVWLDKFTPKYIQTLVGVWKGFKKKAKDKQILLAGRDVFLFELLARLENYPTIFRPDISSTVAKSGLVHQDYSKCCLLDTGYIGTVPKALKIEDFYLLSWSKYPAKPDHIDWTKWLKSKEFYKFKAEHELFPCCGRNYSLGGMAGTLESIAKYWNRGMIKNGQIFQDLAPIGSFSNAAQITRLIGNRVAGVPRRKTYVFSMGRGI